MKTLLKDNQLTDYGELMIDNFHIFLKDWIDTFKLNLLKQFKRYLKEYPNIQINQIIDTYCWREPNFRDILYRNLKIEPKNPKEIRQFNDFLKLALQNFYSLELDSLKEIFNSKSINNTFNDVYVIDYSTDRFTKEGNKLKKELIYALKRNILQNPPKELFDKNPDYEKILKKYFSDADYSMPAFEYYSSCDFTTLSGDEFDKFIQAERFWKYIIHWVALYEIDWLKSLKEDTIENDLIITTAKDLYNYYGSKIIDTFIEKTILESSSFFTSLREITNNKIVARKIIKLNNKDLIDWLIKKKIIKISDTVFINRRIIPYISNQFGKKKIIYQLSNNEYIKLIKTYFTYPESICSKIRFKIKQYNFNSDKQINDVEELSTLKLPENGTINVSSDFYNSTHKVTMVPVIYINGNFIQGQSVLENDIKAVNENTRQYHNNLSYRYTHDMSLHKNDIIKHTLEEWKKLDAYALLFDPNYGKYLAGTAIINGNDLIILTIPRNRELVISKFKEWWHGKTYVTSDDATFIKQAQLYKKVKDS